jgi:hypothetical protein
LRELESGSDLGGNEVEAWLRVVKLDDVVLTTWA